MIEEPESVFLGHTVPYSGHGVSIAEALYRYLKNQGLDADLVVVGSDGTNILVGHMYGALPYLEKLLGHPVHWSICEIHGNELLFWALFKGPLGKLLEGDLSQLPPVRFTRKRNKDFPCLPDDVVADLSSDQHYLYKIVVERFCSPSFSTAKIQVSHTSC